MSEILNINIEDSPPTQEVLDQFRDHTLKRMKEAQTLKKRRGTQGVAIIVCLMLSLVCSTYVAIYFPTRYAILYFIGFGGVLAALAFIIGDTEDEGKVKKDLKYFDNLTDNQIIEYDGYISKHPKIKAYFRKVKSIGRKPIVADLMAAREWVASTPKRQEKKDAQKRIKEARDRMASIIPDDHRL